MNFRLITRGELFWLAFSVGALLALLLNRVGP